MSYRHDDKMTIIRKVTAADKTDWIRMRKELWPDCPEDRHQLEADLVLSSKGVVLVAENAFSKLIGFAEISIRSDHVEGTAESPVPYLEGWYVDADYRSEGIGTSLIRAAEEFALLAGFKELASDAELANTTSIKIHKKIGFREVERTVHFVKSLG